MPTAPSITPGPPQHADDVGAAVELFHGLSDPTRLAILLALLGGERRVASWSNWWEHRSRTCRTTWRAFGAADW